MESEVSAPRAQRTGLPAGVPGTAVLAMTLSGCIGYTSQPLQPGEELRLLVARSEQTLEAEHRGPWSAAWFPLAAEVDFTDGLSLSEANTTALFYAPSVRRVRSDARIAGAQVLQAGLLANPELFVGPRISTDDSEFIVPASLSWELPLWGVEAAEREAAEAFADEQRLQVVEAELDALASVRSAFLECLRIERSEALLSQLADAGQQIVGWTEDLHRAGEVDAVQLFLARAERDEALVALESIRSDLDSARRALFSLIGLLPDAPVTIDTAGAADTPALPSPEDGMLMNRPPLRAAEAAYRAAEAALRLEVRKQYPEIRLGPEFEDDRGDTSIGIGLGISLPLFDRNRGGIAAAEEARQSARDDYVARLLDATHAQAEARAELASAERLLEIHRRGALRDADAAGRALEVRLRAGQADFLEVLSAQKALARAHTRSIELEQRVTAARLRAAITGGFTTTPPDGEPEHEEIER